MALMPKKVKYRKPQRGRVKGNATRGNYVAYGDYGIMALEPGLVTARQIEAARVILSRNVGTTGRYWIRVFPHKAMTATAAETRQGGGKGAVDYWCAVVKPGTILFEISGVPEDFARELFRKQSGKLPVRCKFAKRRPPIAAPTAEQKRYQAGKPKLPDPDEEQAPEIHVVGEEQPEDKKQTPDDVVMPGEDPEGGAPPAAQAPAGGGGQDGPEASK